MKINYPERGVVLGRKSFHRNFLCLFENVWKSSESALTLRTLRFVLQKYPLAPPLVVAFMEIIIKKNRKAMKRFIFGKRKIIFVVYICIMKLATCSFYIWIRLPMSPRKCVNLMVYNSFLLHIFWMVSKIYLGQYVYKCKQYIP